MNATCDIPAPGEVPNSAPNIPPNDRYSRQRDIVPEARLSQCRATIVGVGAIGRQVALQLAAIGIPYLQLIDPDVVETANLAAQGYLEEDLSRPKVQATAEHCQKINSALVIETDPARFRRSAEIGNVVMCCVDSIETRRLIWESVKDRIGFFADGRMSAEVVRVLSVGGESGRRHYPTTLFAAAEAHAGSCTAKSTIFTANITAGLMVEQFTRWLRGLPVDSDLQLNLLSSELSAA